MIREPQPVTLCTASAQSNISSASGLEGLDWGQLRVDGVTVASIAAAQFVLANCLAVSRRSAGSRAGIEPPSAEASDPADYSGVVAKWQ